MVARKGAARVKLPAWFPWKTIYLWDLFLPLVGRGRLFSYRGHFFCVGGGAFSHYVQNFFGAHALVARVIANMLL